jgi:hypothetical protein
MDSDSRPVQPVLRDSDDAAAENNELNDSKLPWLSNQSASDVGPPGVWSLPAAHNQAPVSFNYSTAYALPNANASPFYQHVPDLGSTNNLSSNVNNLGFATVDDWFNGNNDNNGEEAALGSLDLQDFWMKVGPGEVRFKCLGCELADHVGPGRISFPLRFSDVWIYICT